ncbi:hypothetical protein LINPERHAP1_LOCUS10457 [Linum perenne]
MAMTASFPLPGLSSKESVRTVGAGSWSYSNVTWKFPTHLAGRLCQTKRR